MKNISLFNKSIIALLVATIVFSTSCKKQETAAKLPDPNQTTTIKAIPWGPIIAGAVYIIVHVTEGHYTKVTTYNPDGSVASVTEECKGWGSCSIKGETQNSSGELHSVSSVVYGDDYDYTGEAQLVKTVDDKILLMINEENNNTCYKNFFYDKVIEISRPWIIDNPEVLEIIGHKDGKEIIVQGKYEVYEFKDSKYIIIG